MPDDLIIESNINNSYQYGNIELPPDRLMYITQSLNVKKHWWSKREDKHIRQILKEQFELVEIKLGYFPDGNIFNVVFVANSEELDAVQLQMYGGVRHPNVPAFTSLSRFTMYVTIDTLKLRIIRHEFAHMLLHHMLDEKRVTSDFHEHVAQFCET